MLSLIEKERLLCQLDCEIKKGLVSEDVENVLCTWDISTDILHLLLENRLMELKRRGQY